MQNEQWKNQLITKDLIELMSENDICEMYDRMKDHALQFKYQNKKNEEVNNVKIARTSTTNTGEIIITGLKPGKKYEFQIKEALDNEVTTAEKAIHAKNVGEALAKHLS